MSRCHASNASRNAFVTPEFPSVTQCNACNAYRTCGSHIWEGSPIRAAKAALYTGHPLAKISVTSVTTRPPRKNQPISRVTRNASKRYTAIWRTA